jgi:RNA:NAD 2'-phosphotransferase (TPT1/KptA family)
VPFLTTDYYVDVARKLEHGKFDLIFFADRLAIADRYGNDKGAFTLCGPAKQSNQLHHIRFASVRRSYPAQLLLGSAAQSSKSRCEAGIDPGQGQMRHAISKTLDRHSEGDRDDGSSVVSDSEKAFDFAISNLTAANGECLRKPLQCSIPRLGNWSSSGNCLNDVGRRT